MLNGDDRRGITVLFAGGGTGGHLMPGISVAQELLRRRPGARVIFVGSGRPLERELVERHSLEFVELPSLRLPGSPASTPGWFYRAAHGIGSGIRLLARLDPDIVVSLGSYAAVAPGIAAAIRGIPLVILEQNAVPGRANKFLSWWAREVYVPWPGCEASFAHVERVFVTGNPVRSDLHISRSRHLATRFGLSPRKRTLLVLGGSQGARFLNDAMVALLPRFDRESSWLQVLHSTGSAQYESVRAAYAAHRVQASLHPFIEDMAAAYGSCDLALCRGGGTTLAELASLGVPAVVVPLPHATNDHQRRNCAMLAAQGGIIVVEQDDTDVAEIGEVMIRLLRDDRLRAQMRCALLRVGRPAAAARVVDRILEVVDAGRSLACDRLAVCGVKRA